MAEEDRDQNRSEATEGGDGAFTPGGWDGVERRKPEKTFLDQPGLFVSSRRIVVEGHDHPVTKTTSARVHRSTQTYTSETSASSMGKLVFAGGLLAAAVLAVLGIDGSAGFGVRLLRMLPGLAVAGFGVYLMRRQLVRTVILYNAVLYDHAQADVSLASSTDKERIAKIVDAIKEAEATIRDWQMAQHQIKLSPEALKQANREARERSERLMRHSQEDEAARTAGAED